MFFAVVSSALGSCSDGFRRSMQPCDWSDRMKTICGSDMQVLLPCVRNDYDDVGKTDELKYLG